MDPKDLLITNQFLSPETNNDISDDDGNFQDLKNFLDSVFEEGGPLENEQEEFESDEEDNFDLLEDKKHHPVLAANLNRSQWIHGKESSMSQSIMPLLSKTLSDTIKVRYRKQIVSYLNVDSKRRNMTNYPNPGNYRIFLNKEFRNLYSIRLENIIFREPPSPINSSNNCLVWTTDYTNLDGISIGTETEVQYEAKIPGAFYTLGEFVQSVENVVNSVPHDLSGSFIDGFLPMFRFTVDPFTRAIQFIQRLEEYVVTSIKTTKGSNVIEIRVSNQSGVAPSNNNDFPFVVSENLPIVLSGLNLFSISFGGIPFSYLDQIPFYPQATSGNSYSVNSFPSSYDSIRDEYIYLLEVFSEDNLPVYANQSIVTLDNLSESKLPSFPAGHATEVTVGRALPFSIDPCSTFGQYLGLIQSDEMKIVHTNFNTETGQVENKIPWMIIGAGQLTLDTSDYILMRIETGSKPVGTISSNLTMALGNANSGKNKIEENSFFAKIVFAGTQPGDVIIKYTAGDKMFYKAPLVKLDDLKVTFYDPLGSPLNLYQDHSFVLQITEIQEVLRDTLVDSRTGSIADIGSGLVTTNPLD
jgi:hypothetical protein